MTATPPGLNTAVVRTKPRPNVYTVLLLVAILALGVTVAVVLWRLTADLPDGYGLKFADLFSAWEKPTPPR